MSHKVKFNYERLLGVKMNEKEKAIKTALEYAQEFHDNNKQFAGINGLTKIVFQEILRHELRGNAHGIKRD